MSKTEIVKNLRSPYASIAKQLEGDYDLSECFKYLKDADKYDWSNMIPKVTYTDWIVCLYKNDNKLYRVDFWNDLEIREVVVVELLQYNDSYQPIDDNGNVVDDSQLHTLFNNVCCGESDDMSCFIYFDYANS